MKQCRDLLKRVADIHDARYPTTGMAKFWVIEALFRAGLANKALDDIRDYYGSMLDQGATSTWERLDLQAGSPPIENHPVSLCHGWGAGPAYHLPAYALGIKPSSERRSRLRISPSLGDLDWAEGGTALSEGELFVRWEQRDSLRGYLEIPDGVEVVVAANSNELRLGPGKHRID
jgi:hypothetical protein